MFARLTLSLITPRYGSRQGRCRQAANMRLSRRCDPQQNQGDGRCSACRRHPCDAGPCSRPMAWGPRGPWTEMCELRNADTKKPAACGLSCPQRRRRLACISAASSDGDGDRANRTRIAATEVRSRVIQRWQIRMQHGGSIAGQGFLHRARIVCIHARMSTAHLHAPTSGGA